MQKRLIAAVFLSCFLVSGAQADGASEAERALNQAENHFYNGEHDKARERYFAYVQLEPDDPVGCWRWAYNEYFMARHLQKTDEPKLNELGYAQMITMLDRCILKCEKKISSGKNLDFYTYVKAALYGIKGIFQKSNDFGWSAVDSAREMLRLSENSGYQDAKFLAGVLEYKIGLRSWLDRRLAGLLGLPNNRKEGLVLIREAMHGNEGVFSDDIRFAVFDLFGDEKLKEKDVKKIEKEIGVSREELARDLLLKYPRNSALKQYFDSPTKQKN